MSTIISTEECTLLKLIKDSLQGKVHFNMDYLQSISVDEILSMSKEHAVLTSMYEVIKEMPMNEVQKSVLERDSKQVVLQFYRLFFYTKYLVELLEKNGIEVIVLKGLSTASFYPYSELRKSGDIDLLVPKNSNIDRISMILTNVGFQKKATQHSKHHLEFLFDGGIIVEVHTSLTEDFLYKKINRCMNKHIVDIFETKIQENIIGIEFPVLNKPYHAYELLLHALHHFLRTGFGLKFLCDWTMLFKQNWTEEEKKQYEELARESGINSFAELMTETCVAYLGLERKDFAWKYECDNIPIEDFLREVLDAQEFGCAEESRMLMLQGTGIGAYIKEFHHQMHINFPKAGKCFLLWPVLWVITLVKFLYNNRKVRNISTKQILKEAKRRSKLMEKIKILQ